MVVLINIVQAMYYFFLAWINSTIWFIDQCKHMIKFNWELKIQYIRNCAYVSRTANLFASNVTLNFVIILSSLWVGELYIQCSSLVSPIKAGGARFLPLIGLVVMHFLLISRFTGFFFLFLFLFSDEDLVTHVSEAYNTCPKMWQHWCSIPS